MTLKPDMLKWIREGKRGTSSETIFEVLADHPLLCWGQIEYKRNVPHDPSDFYRCYKLLKEIPEFRDRLNKVSEVYLYWKVFTDNWDLLESLLCEENKRKDGNAPKLYRALEEFERVMYDYPSVKPKKVW